MLGLQQLLLQPVQPGAGNHALALAVGSQRVAHGIGSTCRGVSDVPAAGAEGVQRLIQHRTRGNFCGSESFGRQLSLREVARCPCHAANAVGGNGLRHTVLAEHKFGGAAANINHQTVFIRCGQLADYAAVNQRGLFFARDDFNRKAQQLAGAVNEHVAVARFAQCLGGHGAHMRWVKAAQPFTKAC